MTRPLMMSCWHLCHSCWERVAIVCMCMHALALAAPAPQIVPGIGAGATGRRYTVAWSPGNRGCRQVRSYRGIVWCRAWEESRPQCKRRHSPLAADHPVSLQVLQAPEVGPGAAAHRLSEPCAMAKRRHHLGSASVLCLSLRCALPPGHSISHNTFASVSLTSLGCWQLSGALSMLAYCVSCVGLMLAHSRELI